MNANKITMRSPEVWGPIVGMVATIVAVFLVKECGIVQLYESSMRASLFTGLFTLSGFLLAAKTFIVLNMKKEVYSTRVYLRAFRDRRQANDEQPPKDGVLQVYIPLKDTGDLLTANIALTLLASVLQFTLGLFHCWPAVAFCLGLATAAIILLAFSLFFMARNIRKMYVYFEQEAQQMMKSSELDK